GTVVELGLPGKLAERPVAAPQEIQIRPLLKLEGGRGYCIVLSPDQRELITADDGGLVAGWSHRGQETLNAHEQLPSIRFPKFACSGHSIVGADDTGLTELNADTFQPIRRKELFTRFAKALEILPEGDLVLTERESSQEWLVRRQGSDWSVRFEIAFPD